MPHTCRQRNCETEVICALEWLLLRASRSGYKTWFRTGNWEEKPSLLLRLDTSLTYLSTKCHFICVWLHFILIMRQYFLPPFSSFFPSEIRYTIKYVHDLLDYDLCRWGCRDLTLSFTTIESHLDLTCCGPIVSTHCEVSAVITSLLPGLGCRGKLPLGFWVTVVTTSPAQSLLLCHHGLQSTNAYNISAYWLTSLSLVPVCFHLPWLSWPFVQISIFTIF